MMGFRAFSYYYHLVLVFSLCVGDCSCSSSSGDDDPLVEIGEMALKVLRAVRPLLANEVLRGQTLKQLSVYGFQMAHALQDERARGVFWLWQHSIFANTAIDVIYPERLAKKVKYLGSADFASRLAAVVKAVETVEKPLVEFLELNGRDTSCGIKIQTNPSLLLATVQTSISGVKSLIDRHLTVADGSNINLYTPSNLFVNHVGQDCNLVSYVQAKDVGINWGNVAQSLVRSYESAMVSWVSEFYVYLQTFNDLFFLIVRISLYAYIRVHATVFRDYYMRHTEQSQHSDASKRLWKILERSVLDFTEAIGIDYNPTIRAMFVADFDLLTVGDTIEMLDKAALDASKITNDGIGVNEKELFKLYTNPEKTADWEAFSVIIHNNSKAAEKYFDFVKNSICRNVRYAETNLFFDLMLQNEYVLVDEPSIDDSKTAAEVEE